METPDAHARRKTLALTGLIALQGLCAAVFAADAIADLAGLDPAGGGRPHLAVEIAATLALILGVAVTAVELRRLLRRQSIVETQLRAASGAFLEVLEEHFDRWRLTPAERDVALLGIKGLSIAEIAAVRETREGTVKAQLNAIYAKAGVSGRPQLLSLFIEELLGGGLGAPGALRAGAAPAAAAAAPSRAR